MPADPEKVPCPVCRRMVPLLGVRMVGDYLFGQPYRKHKDSYGRSCSGSGKLVLSIG